MNLKSIPLSQLVADENIRRTPAAADDDKRLRASIAAHGLLQNLIIRPSEEPPFQVVAGSRRLAALQDLYGEADGEMLILCREIADDCPAATEAALAENTIRVGMHIADEAEAVRTVREQGVSAAEIGRRFGLSCRRVAQLIRLSTIHPDILQKAREGEFGVDELQAFAVTSDQEAQVAILPQLRAGWGRTAGHIRQLLTEGWKDAKDSLAKFVGIEPYEKAGGKVERDLFDSQRRLRDIPLLENLASDKLQELAAEVRTQGWKWVEVIAQEAHKFTRDLIQMRRGYVGLTEAEHARLAEVRERVRALRVPRSGRETRNLKALEDEADTLHSKKHDRLPWTPEEIAAGGCVVSIGWSGEPSVDEGYVKPEDRALLPATQKRSYDPGAAAEASAPSRQKQKKADSGLGVALAQRLRNTRKGIVTRAMMAPEAFGAAFDLLAYTLAIKTFQEFDRYAERATEHGTEPVHLKAEFPGFQKDPEALAAVPLGWMKPKSPAKRFQAFRKLAETDKGRLFSMAVGSQMNAQLALDVERSPEVEATIKSLGISFESEWRPTKDYWASLKKPALLAVCDDVLTDDEADSRAKLKKGELVVLLEAVFRGQAGDGGDLPQLILKRIARWTPPGFRPGK